MMGGFSKRVFYREIVARYQMKYNKGIRMGNKPIFYKTFFESGFNHVIDLRFDLNTTVIISLQKKHFFSLGRPRSCCTILVKVKFKIKPSYHFEITTLFDY